MSETPIRKRAESAVAQRLVALKSEKIFRSKWPSHTKLPEDNLVTGVTRRDFWDDLEKADGNELSDSPPPAKFCAAHSSSALAVNNFGPFRHSSGNLVLAGHGDFSNAKFERKCPTPLRGTPPNLDFLVDGPEFIVAVESKFLEPLLPTKAKFANSYGTVIGSLDDPVWQTMYKSLIDEPTKFVHLDAAQLVKHYLGIRHTFRNYPQAKVLMYLFWEPTNVVDIPEFVNHRHEVDLFSKEVEESKIRFVAISYQGLWQYWSKESAWGGMAAHIQALRQRYELVI